MTSSTWKNFLWPRMTMKYSINSKPRNKMKLKMISKTRCQLLRSREAGMSGLDQETESTRIVISKSKREPWRSGKRGYKTSRTRDPTTRWKELCSTPRRETRNLPWNTWLRSFLILIIVWNNTKRWWAMPLVRSGPPSKVTRDSFSQMCSPRLERLLSHSGLRRMLLLRLSISLCNTDKTKGKRGLLPNSEFN